jgi:hypothetical protein
MKEELLVMKVADREVGKNNGNKLRLARGRAGRRVAAKKC